MNSQVILGQLLVGLINGSFYAMMGLGLAADLRPARHPQHRAGRLLHDGRLLRLDAAFKLATLTDVHWTTSGNVVLMTLLGGLGTLFGPVAGAAVFVTLENYLADAGLPIQMTIAAIVILCILLFRRGLVGEVLHWAEWRRIKAGRGPDG